MKKTLLAIIAALLIIPFVLGACDKKKDDTPVVPDTPETEAQQETETTEPAAPEDLNAVAARLMENYNVLQYVDTLSLDVDEEVEYWDENGLLYHPVTDPDFQSIGDIWELLYDTFTANDALEEFPDLANLGVDDNPYWYIFVDEEGFPKGLYSMQVYNGFSLYNLNGDIEVSDQTDTSFTAYCPCEYFGMDTSLTLYVVKEDGKWLIAGIAYGGFDEY